jgi:hypothetical protein
MPVSVTRVPTKPFPSNAIPSGKNSCSNRWRQLPSSDALERSKGKNSAVIVLEQELEQTVTQPAGSVA